MYIINVDVANNVVKDSEKIIVSKKVGKYLSKNGFAPLSHYDNGDFLFVKNDEIVEALEHLPFKSKKYIRKVGY